MMNWISFFLVAFATLGARASTVKALPWPSSVVSNLRAGALAGMTCADAKAAKSDYCRALAGFEKKQKAKPNFSQLDPSTLTIEFNGTPVKIQRTDQTLEFLVNGEELTLDPNWAYADLSAQIAARVQKSSRVWFLEEARAQEEKSPITILISALLVEGVRAQNCDELAAYAAKCNAIVGGGDGLWVKGYSEKLEGHLAQARETLSQYADSSSKAMTGTEKLSCAAGVKKKMAGDIANCQSTVGLLNDRAHLCAAIPSDTRCDGKSPSKKDVASLQDLDRLNGTLAKIVQASEDPEDAAKEAELQKQMDKLKSELGTIKKSGRGATKSGGRQ